MFQFHNGTINTEGETIEDKCKRRFNSTTVQLIRYLLLSDQTL